METYIIILLCAAFAAGFIDAIVGGGGLIQTPRINLLPFTCFNRYRHLKYLLSAELHLRPVPEKGNDGLEIITHNGIGRVAFLFLGSFTYLYE
jgi:hypothetical protein